MYKRPETNLLTAYTKGLEGWADRVVPPAVARTVYVGPSLTGRGPVAWGEKTQAAADAEAQAASEAQGLLSTALTQQ